MNEGFDLPAGWARGLGHVFLLMAVVWFALSLNWMATGEPPHALITFLIGAACGVAGEWLRSRECCDCQEA